MIQRCKGHGSQVRKRVELHLPISVREQNKGMNAVFEKSKQILQVPVLCKGVGMNKGDPISVEDSTHV